MKICSVLLAAILLALLPIQIDARDLIAESYVVMEVKSGKILYSQNADVPMWPASTTKIMTCALTLLNANDNDMQTITHTAIAPIEWDTSHIALTPGEVVPVRDLLYATMIHSANDAANGLAEYNSGSTEEFAKLMTNTAAAIGCQNTTFQNPSGLFHEDHLTTTHDMATITRWALSIPGFRELFGETKYTMQPTNLQPDERYFATRNKLMSNTQYYYNGNCGGKTGWLPESGHTLSTLAEKDGMELICVLFNTPYNDQIFLDAKTLFDKAFSEYDMQEVRTETLNLQPVSLLQEETQIGTVSFLNESIAFPKPNSLPADEINTVINIPQSYRSEQDIRPTVSFFTSDGNLLYQHELKFETHYLDLPAIAALQATAPKEPMVIPSNLLLYMIACILIVTVLTVYYNHRYAKLERQYQQRVRAKIAKKYHR